MPSIEENYEFWNDRFLWAKHRGDVWSREWGGPQQQWAWCLYPRIRNFLPTDTILEIGPGQGRWTRFLLKHCDHLILSDISDKCIKACQERFGDSIADYQVGDGKTLSFQPDNSVDFVFSFESLIHTELSDLDSYLKEILRVLKPQGMAFLHHSNLAEYRAYYTFVLGIPKGPRELLQSRGILDFDGWRAPTVSADLVASTCEKLGLTVHSQELVPWGGRRLIDCFTTLGKNTQAESKLLRNHHFVKRAREIKRIGEVYGEMRENS